MQSLVYVPISHPSLDPAAIQRLCLSFAQFTTDTDRYFGAPFPTGKLIWFVLFVATTLLPSSALLQAVVVALGMVGSVVCLVILVTICLRWSMGSFYLQRSSSFAKYSEVFDEDHAQIGPESNSIFSGESTLAKILAPIAA